MTSTTTGVCPKGGANSGGVLSTVISLDDLYFSRKPRKISGGRHCPVSGCTQWGLSTHMTQETCKKIKGDKNQQLSHVTICARQQLQLVICYVNLSPEYAANVNQESLQNQESCCWMGIIADYLAHLNKSDGNHCLFGWGSLLICSLLSPGWVYRAIVFASSAWTVAMRPSLGRSGDGSVVNRGR